VPLNGRQFSVTNGHAAASVSHPSRNGTSDSCIFQCFPFRRDVETLLIVRIPSPPVQMTAYLCRVLANWVSANANRITPCSGITWFLYRRIRGLRAKPRLRLVKWSMSVVKPTQRRLHPDLASCCICPKVTRHVVNLERWTRLEVFLSLYSGFVDITHISTTSQTCQRPWLRQYGCKSRFSTLSVFASFCRFLYSSADEYYTHLLGLTLCIRTFLSS